MSSDSTSLVIILVCLVLSAYFSATETAFSTMSHARMKTMADKGDKSAALALQLADNYDTLLSAILIGNNLVNILLSSVATLLFVKFLGEQTGASVATASVTVVVLIFGEISPKSIATENGGIWQKGIFASHRRNTRQKIFCKKQESKQIQRPALCRYKVFLDFPAERQ